MTEEIEFVLEELANRFEMSGNGVWTGPQVADFIRRFMADRDVILTNRDDEGRD
jgi:hypothetical protein